ncbi:hypothetical protein ACIQUY_29470 [Streptomyces sp. NPDC090231]|uniref:hypothetical protein n=1 Tax=unclassified Streptomyces TaxID=2593676 RepID=UPI0037F9AA15
MNERDRLAAAVDAMGALPMPIGDTATAAELEKDTRGVPRRGESTPGRPSKVAAFLAGARNGRAMTAVSGD